MADEGSSPDSGRSEAREGDIDGDSGYTSSPSPAPLPPLMTSLASASASARPRITALLALIFLVNLAMSLYQLPLNRVIERRICRDYYLLREPLMLGPDGNVDEKFCKRDGIQQGLAWIQGVMETAWTVGDLLMTIPLGFVAERYGRRAVFFLNLVPRVSMLLWAIVVGSFQTALPTRAIVAAPFLSVLGGDCVFNSLTYAMAAGMTDNHALRASFFGYMSSVTYVVALLGPALASATMKRSLWLPFWIGTVLLLLAGVVVMRLPPDHPIPGHHHRADDVGRSDDEEQSSPLITPAFAKSASATTSSAHSVLSLIAARFRTLRAVVTSHPRNFTLLLASFLLTSLASSDTKLLVVYISKRYHWAIASAGYLLSAKAVVNFVLLGLVIPRLLQRRASSAGRFDAAPRDPRAADRASARYAAWCIGVSVVGAASIAVAPSIGALVPALLVYALGSALPIFTLSLLKSPAVSPAAEDNSSTAAADVHGTETQIFSIVMLVKTLGSLVGAPVMAASWVHGIAVGGVGYGTPYFVSAACYLAAMAVFSYIRI